LKTTLTSTKNHFTATKSTMSVFTMKLAIVLAGASAAIPTSTAVAVAVDSSTMLSVMGQGALDEQNFSVFTKCVQSLKSSYRAYADEGVLVVIPPTNRTIDIKTTDEEMWKCIESSVKTISLAIESTEFFDQVHETSTHLTTLRHTDALRMGIKGQAVIGHVPAPAKANTLQSRDVGYFYQHSSFYNDCAGDYNYYYINTCYGWASAVASTSAGNLDSVKCLNYSIWPHHDCAQGNYRTIGIAPLTQCTCQVRTTYSFHGYYC
jgi:hypothetical protein